MGAVVAGHFPCELEISKDDYMRWFEMIQEMGANDIRVYTVLKLEFYEALVRYNRSIRIIRSFSCKGMKSGRTID